MKSTLIAALIQRMKTQSPNLYKQLMKWSMLFATPMGLIALTSVEAPEFIPQFPHVDLVIKICKFGTALLLGVTVTSSTTTIKPELMSEETKQAVIEHAAEKGDITINN